MEKLSLAKNFSYPFWKQPTVFFLNFTGLNGFSLLPVQNHE